MDVAPCQALVDRVPAPYVDLLQLVGRARLTPKNLQIKFLFNLEHVSTTNLGKKREHIVALNPRTSFYGKLDLSLGRQLASINAAVFVRVSV